MIRKKENRLMCIIVACLLIFISITIAYYDNVYAAPVPLDTTIEDSRDSGTDLYEATKCYNVLPLTIDISTGESSSTLLDESYASSIGLTAGTEITVSCETEMNGIYIIWDSLIPEWQMKIGENTYTFGEYGFLHEYVKLPEKTNSLTIIVPNGSDLGTLGGVYTGGARISDIYAFDSDDLPSYVQLWQPPLDKADILVFTTHADDEDIFFGGFVPIYGAEKGLGVQIVYFTQHWDYAEGSKIREHEKLNGLWLAGDVYYPILGNFKDGWSTDYEGAAAYINPDDATLFLTECIRRTKPQVIVSHDFDGEYGHGQHILVTSCATEAVEYAADDTYDPASADLYGTWDTPKMYIHLYDENPIKLDLRQSLTAFDGKRAIDVARQAYLCHESQQWCSFTIDDYGPYDNSSFGLYRTTVGPDVNCNDVMENLVSYEEQARLEEEAKLEEEARLEEEAQAQQAAEVSSNTISSNITNNVSDTSTGSMKLVEAIIVITFLLISIICIIAENKLMIRRNKNKKNRNITSMQDRKRR